MTLEIGRSKWWEKLGYLHEHEADRLVLPPLHLERGL